MSWEDEQLLHQFDDKPSALRDESAYIQKEYKKHIQEKPIQIDPSLQSDNLDETL